MQDVGLSKTVVVVPFGRARVRVHHHGCDRDHSLGRLPWALLHPRVGVHIRPHCAEQSDASSVK